MIVTGDKVSLGPFVANDFLPLFRWFNDTESARLDSSYRPIDWASHKAWFETIGKDFSKVLFAVRRIGDDNIVGYVSIANINSIHRSAEMGVRIGEEKDRGQGLGCEAIRLGLDFCWKQLNLHRISLSVFKHNQRAIRTYAKAGFKKEGVLRSAAYIDGSWVDVVVMAILRPPARRTPATRNARAGEAAEAATR